VSVKTLTVNERNKIISSNKVNTKFGEKVVVETILKLFFRNGRTIKDINRQLTFGKLVSQGAVGKTTNLEFLKE
jgi:hypothetical protein